MNRGNASHLVAKNLTMRPFLVVLSVQNATPKTRLPAEIGRLQFAHDHLNYFGGAKQR